MLIRYGEQKSYVTYLLSALLLILMLRCCMLSDMFHYVIFDGESGKGISSIQSHNTEVVVVEVI